MIYSREIALQPAKTPVFTYLFEENGKAQHTTASKKETVSPEIRINLQLCALRSNT
jgi:hypothetical protein